MTVYYLCDTLKAQNSSNVEIELNAIYKSNVQFANRIDATVICEITIPGIKRYKSVQRNVIPKYSSINMLNKSSGNWKINNNLSLPML